MVRLIALFKGMRISEVKKLLLNLMAKDDSHPSNVVPWVLCETLGTRLSFELSRIDEPMSTQVTTELISTLFFQCC